MSTLRNSGRPPVERWPERACAGVNTELFFVDGPGTSSKARMAKAFCRSCPARRACLAYALPIENLDGIWGGLTPPERTRARKKQQKEA